MELQLQSNWNGARVSRGRLCRKYSCLCLPCPSTVCLLHFLQTSFEFAELAPHYLGGANFLGKIDGLCPYRKAFCGDKGEIADAAPPLHIVIEIEGLQGAGASSLLTTIFTKIHGNK